MRFKHFVGIWYSFNWFSGFSRGSFSGWFPFKVCVKKYRKTRFGDPWAFLAVLWGHFKREFELLWLMGFAFWRGFYSVFWRSSRLQAYRIRVFSRDSIMFFGFRVVCKHTELKGGDAAGPKGNLLFWRFAGTQNSHFRCGSQGKSAFLTFR